MTSFQLLTTRQKSIAFVLIMLIWRQTQMLTLAVLCLTPQNLLLENNLSVFFLWLIIWSVVPLVSYFKLCVGVFLFCFLIRGGGEGIVLLNIHRGEEAYYTGKRERESEGSIAGTYPEDHDAMDRCQNNKMLIKAVSARHCAATSVPRNCCPNCCAE